MMRFAFVMRGSVAMRYCLPGWVNTTITV
jgi:hypothetical protein